MKKIRWSWLLVAIFASAFFIREIQHTNTLLSICKHIEIANKSAKYYKEKHEKSESEIRSLKIMNDSLMKRVTIK